MEDDGSWFNSIIPRQIDSKKTKYAEETAEGGIESVLSSILHRKLFWYSIVLYYIPVDN